MSVCGQELSKIKLERTNLDILQVNLGMVCNQACVHCHHNAGPGRTEMMSAQTSRKVLEFFRNSSIPTLELTGGAPELNPNFKDMIRRARSIDRRVVVRSNLTVLFEDGMEGLPSYYADNNVELVCSMPCYLKQNVNAQRGNGAYEKSIKALRMLNELGYGIEGSSLKLNLVYNPGGAFLPGDQCMLDGAYHENLRDMHGIDFNILYTISNMPIGRFAQRLRDAGEYDDYMTALKDSANIQLLNNAMCRSLISIGWGGYVYDCDFNQALSLTMGGTGKRLWELSPDELQETPIVLGEHCYGCIAGNGSSCTGSLN
ncbi:MAG TPA: arsenosugar biosynthesis radical SAM (seleno)protein ArsS [Candidatus Aquicultor sp.]